MFLCVICLLRIFLPNHTSRTVPIHNVLANLSPEPEHLMRHRRTVTKLTVYIFRDSDACSFLRTQPIRPTEYLIAELLFYVRLRSWCPGRPKTDGISPKAKGIKNRNMSSAVYQAQDRALVCEYAIGIHSLQYGWVSLILTVILLLPSMTRSCGPLHRLLTARLCRGIVMRCFKRTPSLLACFVTRP